MLALSHAGQWLNTARRVLAHVRAYLDSGQYGECRDSEQACLRTCRHGSVRQILIYPNLHNIISYNARYIIAYFFTQKGSPLTEPPLSK